ncbi:LEAF RUST 10 DISEASE-RESISTANCEUS RECEPTOR-LIKE PROTEIN KINASE-like 2.4 [Primulina huaijiensis]|uniref:LEAF RUST 10 DISEASE-RESISTANCEUS RECEPTOR-LIKE PROTEIN KINASE-like 2.4 n=1 Tax=Primulina huaijiensis TaxID=1492673 RepID=UPI003CC6FE0C
MLRKNYLLLTCLILVHFIRTSYSAKQHHCKPSFCGDIHKISYPFRLKDDPKHCGDHHHEIFCENNTTALIYLDYLEYHVRAINYQNSTIRVADASIKKNITCSFPLYSPKWDELTSYRRPYDVGMSWPITFITCPFALKDSIFIETEECVNRIRHTYIKVGHFNVSYVRDMCTINNVIMSSFPLKDENNISLAEIHDALLYGFELPWIPMRKYGRGSWLFVSFQSSFFFQHILYFSTSGGIYTIKVSVLSLGYKNCKQCLQIRLFMLILSRLFLSVSFAMVNVGLRFMIGVPFLLCVIVYKFRRRHLSMFDLIEGFLQSHNNLMPIRYSYSEIKKMTRGFREKLGQGGYGSVYKGKLRSGNIVAVKLLSKPSTNGQDFINEVATIGRIHHINVVKLVGYCAERSKCALVYDFMPNGSLDKYIFSKEKDSDLLTWDRKYGIAIGVARGIEYLHRGCDIQILHFDIKPHNILLDEHFTSKISDFGLAKFYSTDKNTVTLTAIRGTIGYVAPELIHRSIGGVSYKADVYSFGMLLIEMVGLRRDLGARDQTSSKYFPYWIYDCFNKGRDIEIGNVDENDNQIVRRMTIVALWCIQLSPGDRPSMSKVLEMLESADEFLQIPPQPSELPRQFAAVEDQTWETNSTDSIALLVDDLSRVYINRNVRKRTAIAIEQQ